MSKEVQALLDITNAITSFDSDLDESLLLEKTRQELINKTRNSDNYTTKGREHENRYTRRLKSQIANSVRDYNRIDMDTFWRGDILDFDVKVKGETNNYIVTLTFSKILYRLRQEVKANNDKLEFKCVLRALIGSFNSDDELLVGCTCPDWTYRQAFWATRGKYNSVDPQPSNGKWLRNPRDTKGGGCKHVALVLSNLDWMMKIASVINNYVKWCRDNMEYNYATYIFPEIYGVPYKQAVQMSIFQKYDKWGDAILDSDRQTIDDVISQSTKDRDASGRFTKGNEYRFTKKEKPKPEKEDSTFNADDDSALNLRFGDEDAVDNDKKELALQDEGEE